MKSESRRTNWRTSYFELAVRQPNALVPLVAETLGKRGKMPSPFVVQLVQRLREQDPSLIAVTDWLEKRLEQQNTSIEQEMHSEHQRQAATQITVGDIITSMRLLSALDWRDFFESVGLVDPILGEEILRRFILSANRDAGSLSPCDRADQ